MQLERYFVVFVILLGRLCFSKILIKTNKLGGYAELEDAAITLLSKCYGDKDKTMVLTGDIPGTFVKKLSPQRSHSIVLLESLPDADSDNWEKNFSPNESHKVHILVAMATSIHSLGQAIHAFKNSKYSGSMVSLLIIGWSPRKTYGPCNVKIDIVNTLLAAHIFEMPNANMICRDIKKGIVIYSYNAFTNYAPKPWQLAGAQKWFISGPPRPDFSYFMRQYRKHEEMCENLFFEKMRNMNGFPIEILIICDDPPCPYIIPPKNERVDIEAEINTGWINDFFRYVNATQQRISQKIVVGEATEVGHHVLQGNPTFLKGIPLHKTHSYPYGRDCKFLVTQYRGNKSQLRKILDVLDGYSWGGMIGVYFITLIFFKYFLRQPLTMAILNLWRLTCSLGLPELPPNVPPRIYLGSLLLFIVTIHGIFTSSLASVITQDIPVRQVNTIQDLTDFGYTVYAYESDFVDFKAVESKGRLLELLPYENCLKYVAFSDSVACWTYTEGTRTYAIDAGLYVSRDCIKHDISAIPLPQDWALQEIFDKYLGVKTAGGFMTNFDVVVRLKRRQEKELEEKVIEPKVIVLSDLGFAFVIWGIGLGYAIVTFIVEVMISIYHKKARIHPKFSWIRRRVR